MQSLPWKPWHQVVHVRDDLKSGELSLAMFAADLHDVAMGKARPIYQDPQEFFALTYPTFNMRELVKDVALRLAGKNEKAIRQLELTYGGGKTHTLITLLHLVSDPANLPKLPAVDEFIQHIGMSPPATRVVVLPFDKLDVEKGMEVRSPSGEARWLRNPWSVVAFQIAGEEGLRRLHAEGEAAERDSAPAENLLVDLLAIPGQENLSTLILIDEVLMYAREKVAFDPVWRDKLLNFFQYLTQAVTKIDRCAIVASLLATDPTKSDTLGKEITRDLYNIFRREREESVQPVLKEDVAEVLRRRLFTPESILDREAFRPHVMAALKGIADLDDQTRKEGKAAEERFLKSYPFHPDLTEVFYTKWTNLEGFQRTRGILRTFALALRSAPDWDNCPLVAANVFLNEANRPGISEAARELTNTATTEEYEGRRQEWTSILEGELAKAVEIQKEYPGLRYREVEQSVFATFLHSQPIGQKALTRDLLLLLGHTRPDKIELEKALKRWVETSWFLDEEAAQEAGGSLDGVAKLPKSWKLGAKPNLRQMHDAACRDRVPADLVETELIKEINKLKTLTDGARAAGAIPHMLPKRPNDIADDGNFHYAVLGPEAASAAGNPNPEAQRFINETTGPDRPRVYRNAVVLLVPSVDGLELARQRILQYHGWLAVREQIQHVQKDEPLRWQILLNNMETARQRIAPAIRQAYSIVVTVSDKNEVEGFRIKQDDGPLFNTVKADLRARIQETAITAEALLPGGPYDLWREGEESRRVKDLVGAFAQNYELPKMLNSQAILDTLIAGCVEGNFVMRVTRADRSIRTFWRQRPDDVALKEPSLEMVLPENATITELSSSLLKPGELPSLWDASSITLNSLFNYFSGEHVVDVPKDGYTEPVFIPHAEPDLIKEAVQTAVENGHLWLISGPASIFKEEIPPGILNENVTLQAPPEPINHQDILPENLPDAWEGDITTALSIATVLSQKAGVNLPWPIVRQAISTAINYQRALELTLDSGLFPCEYSGVKNVKLRVRQPTTPQPTGTVSGGQRPLFVPQPGVLAAAAELKSYQIQDFAEQIDELMKAAVGHELKIHLRLELSGSTPPSDEAIAKINELLKEIGEDFELR
jgi:hypothetical protein